MIIPSQITKCLSVCIALSSLGAFCDSAKGEEKGSTLFREILGPPSVPLSTKVIIGEQKSLMIIETGAVDTMIDSSFRRMLTLIPAKKGNNTLDGKVKGGAFYECPSIHLQSLELLHPAVTVDDFARRSQLLGHKVSGYLGARAFDKGKLLIAYSKNSLEFHSGPWRLSEPDFREQALVASVPPQIECEIGNHRCKFIIGVGDAGCIYLEASVFDVMAAEGIIESTNGEAGNASIAASPRPRGGYFIKGKLMDKDLRGMSVVSEEGVSILGDEWLCGFDSEIDFPGRQFRFRQIPGARAPVDPWTMFGAMLTYDELGAKVESLRPDGKGAAESGGLKAGDLINSIAELKGEQLNAVTFAETIAANAGGTIDVEFVRVSDGTNVKAKLKLPPSISPWNFGGRDLLNNAGAKSPSTDAKQN